MRERMGAGWKKPPADCRKKSNEEEGKERGEKRIQCGAAQ